MREWPREIAVQLESSDGSPVDHLLVVLTVRYRGRYYYGTLLGLSGPGGTLRVAGTALAAKYQEAQQMFMMDYKLPMAQWDEHAIVELPDGREFEARRQAALAGPWDDPPSHALWSGARNAGVAAATAVVAFDGGSAAVTLPVRRVGLP